MKRSDIQDQFKTAIKSEKSLIPTMVEYKGIGLTTSYTDYCDDTSWYIALSTYGADLHESIIQYLKNLKLDSLNQVMDTIDAAYKANAELETEISSLIENKIKSYAR